MSKDSVSNLEKLLEAYQEGQFDQEFDKMFPDGRLKPAPLSSESSSPISTPESNEKPKPNSNGESKPSD